MEAIEAGAQGLLERQNAPPDAPQRDLVTTSAGESPSLSIQAHTVEEAADQTLARQATGLLGKACMVAWMFC